MYYPFLRGKLFELVALRELSDNNSLTHVIPIIEPVQDNYNALNKAVNVLSDNQSSHILIIKPNVGSETNEGSIRQLIDQIDFTDSLIPGFIIDGNNDQLIDTYVREIGSQRIALIHNSQVNRIEDVVENHNLDIINVINNDKVGPFYKRNFTDLTNILLRDPFTSEDRNADYLEVDEQNFSNDHKFYNEEGFEGYGDFTTVGSSYSDSGFAPYAVAIHLSYMDADDNCWVKHFVSNSNDDQSNTPGKYLEAVTKLHDWITDNDLLYQSSAIDEFNDLFQRQHYPGLGYLKKLSIKHHVEMINNYFS